MDPRSPPETIKLFENHSVVKFEGIHLNGWSVGAKMFSDSLSSGIDEMQTFILCTKTSHYVKESQIRILKISTFENHFSTEVHLKTTFSF